MKLVTTIIRPFKLDEVRDALTKIGVQGLTVTEVRGYGRQKGHAEIYRGAEYAERFLPKIKVEIACLSNQVDKVIETIISSAKTGKIGDARSSCTASTMRYVFAPAKPTPTRSERRFPPAPRYQWSQTSRANCHWSREPWEQAQGAGAANIQKIEDFAFERIDSTYVEQCEQSAQRLDTRSGGVQFAARHGLIEKQVDMILAGGLINWPRKQRAA